MVKNTLQGIDATNIRCPEFTGPVLRLIKKIGAHKQCVIKTKETHALKRLTHLCEVYQWNVIGYQLQGEVHFIAVQINDID